MSAVVAMKEWPRGPATYRVTLGYDGSQFHGYAQQPEVPTVEAALRRALSPFESRLPLAVAGRTDRGVHATGQVVSFKLRAAAPTAELIDALSHAHPSIWIDELRRVPRWFHAAFSARTRRYVYLAPAEPGICVVRLQRQLDGLVGGRRCFHAFARDTPPGRDTRRRLLEARVRTDVVHGQPQLRFDFCADGFLRRMVRVLVATALRSVHEGGQDDALVRLADTRDRRATARPASPTGLYLTAIAYDPAPV